MDAERWRMVEELYYAAVQLEEGKRGTFLCDACTGDERLRSEIESLLAYDKEVSSFIESPALDLAAESLAKDLSTMVDRVPASGAVSHYRVIERIGQGGMGVVYKAEDTTLHRFVALKFPHGRYRDPRALARLRREARAASALDHPNICTIYEIGEQDGEPFIAMQFLDGQTLKQLIAGKALNICLLLDLAVQISDALEAAHQANIVHRDIKPANLFVTGRGQLKVLDFGVAKLHVHRPPAALADRLRLKAPTGPTLGPTTSTHSGYATSPGTLIGTVAYMSPEQVRGEELDARTDLFSFGAVLYEMATGTPPFQGETPVLICNSILNGSPARAKGLNPGVPAALESILGKALEKDRELRYQSAVDMGAELRRLAPSVGSGHPAGLGRTGRLREAAFRLGVLVSVMAIVAAAAFWRYWGVRTESQLKPVERQITAHPPEDYVTGGAISPDGKTVAYHDQTGLYLRSVDSGDTHAVSLRPEFQNRISDLTWFPDGKRLLAPIEASTEPCHPDLWTISATGEPPPRLLWRDVCQASISPDGGSIAFMRDMHGSSFESAGVWVAQIKDGSQRKLRARVESEFLFSPVWSPDGRWIAYLHVRKTPDAYTTTIDEQPATGGPTKTILSDTSLPKRTMICYLGAAGLCLSWSPDWRIVFSAHTDDWVRAADIDYSLWEVSTKRGTAEAAGKPKRLAHWGDFGPGGLAITADGKRISFLKNSTWSDVYLAELASGTKIQPPRRITLENRGSYPSGWTLDSQAILFSSDRTARREIFRQALNVDFAAPIAQASGKDCDGAIMSPDGSWILFRESERVIPTASPSPVRLVRQRAPGGVPETVLEEPADLQWWYACGVKPHSSCILSQTEGADVVFYALDPLRGKGAKLGQVKRPYWRSSAEWNISPDGSRVAFVTDNGRIEMLSVRDRTWQEISLETDWQRLISIAWAADGKGFFVTCWRPDSFDLAHVNLTGKVTPLLQNGRRQWFLNPLSSPNGKYLAFEAETWDSNVWMMENF